MAGNNSIQILRIANLASTANSGQLPLDGQPFYDKATRKLFVGDGINVLANYRNLDKGIVAGGLNAPWGSIVNSAGSMKITAQSLNVVSNLDASIDITRDFDMHSGYNIDVDAYNNINMNALAFNANAATNANHFASLSLSNQGISINANMQGNGKVDIYGSAGVNIYGGGALNIRSKSDGSGSINMEGLIYEKGQRVYSPNNPPPSNKPTVTNNPDGTVNITFD